jgi:hypothetical protein
MLLIRYHFIHLHIATRSSGSSGEPSLESDYPRPTLPLSHILVLHLETTPPHPQHATPPHPEDLSLSLFSSLSPHPPHPPHPQMETAHEHTGIVNKENVAPHFSVSVEISIKPI